MCLYAEVCVKARRKSLFSTMRKVLRDGRAREDVHDLLGIRVIVTPQPGSPSYSPPAGAGAAGATGAAGGGGVGGDAAAAERSAMAACYRAQQIAHVVFDVVAGRTKDYLQRPKANGYRSLHSTLRLPQEWTAPDGGVNNAGGGATTADDDASVSSAPAAAAGGKIIAESDGGGGDDGDGDGGGRRVELQIRTAAMHAAAEMGAAAHTAYKGGFKEDPGAADALAELVTAANAAAEERFGSFTEAGLSEAESDEHRMFRMFDLDGDGCVTRDELRTVIADVWDNAGDGEDGGAGVKGAADELIAMLDTDEDGTVSPEEFARFRASIKVLGSLPGADAATAAAIEGKFAAPPVVEVVSPPSSSSSSSSSFEAVTYSFDSASFDDIEEAEDENDDNDDDDENAEFADDTIAGQASWDDAAAAADDAADAVKTSSEVKITDAEVVATPAAPQPATTEVTAKTKTTTTMTTTTDEKKAKDEEVEEEEKEEEMNAVAAAAAAQAMSPPPLPPAPPAGRVRPADETIRDASKALKDKTGGAVEWQLVWDLMRAGRPETARELFYQRTSRTPSVTGLWEQWARFELLQGDAERARGLYRAALLHAEGQPRARAESLRKWAVMEFGAGATANAAGLFERALNVLQEAEEAAAAAEEAEGVEHLGGYGSGSGSDDEFDYDYDEVSDEQKIAPACAFSESAASLRAAQAVVLHAWSQAESRVGSLDNARELLNQAAECDEGNPRVGHSLAQLDEASGDFHAARARYAAAAATHPGDTYVALSRARLEWRVFGDADAARDIFTRAADANPTNYRVLQAWGIMEMRQGAGKKKSNDNDNDNGNGNGTGQNISAARRLFGRAADLAPWAPQVWCAWAQAEWTAKTDAERVRELYAKVSGRPTDRSRAPGTHTHHHHHTFIQYRRRPPVACDSRLFHVHTRNYLATCFLFLFLFLF